MDATEFERGDWKLTQSLIENTTRNYWFDRSRVLEMLDGDSLLYNWPIHMSAKGWCNIEDFCDVWTFAAAQDDQFDEKIWALSVAEAYRARARSRIWRRIDKRLYPSDDALRSSTPGQLHEEVTAVDAVLDSYLSD